MNQNSDLPSAARFSSLLISTMVNTTADSVVVVDNVSSHHTPSTFEMISDAAAPTMYIACSNSEWHTRATRCVNRNDCISASNHVKCSRTAIGKNSTASIGKRCLRTANCCKI